MIFKWFVSTILTRGKGHVVPKCSIPVSGWCLWPEEGDQRTEKNCRNQRLRTTSGNWFLFKDNSKTKLTEHHILTFEEQFVHLSQREVILVVEYQLNCLDSLHCQKTLLALLKMSLGLWIFSKVCSKSKRRIILAAGKALIMLQNCIWVQLRWWKDTGWEPLELQHLVNQTWRKRPFPDEGPTTRHKTHQ